MIFPAGPPLLAYVVGTVLGWQFPSWRGLFGVALVLCLPPALVLPLSCARPLLKILPLMVCFLLLAALRTSVGVEPVFPSDHIVHQASGEPVLLEGVLCRQPTILSASTRLSLEARCIRSPEGTKTVRGRADVWTSGRRPDLWIGDILLVDVRLKVPRSLGNPGEIDRRARSFLEGVHVRGSVGDGGHLFCVGVADGYRFERFVQQIRVHLSAFFDREGDPNVRGLLRAWFLGDRSGLDESLVEAFRCSGLAHLLAISGLHVGLVGLFAYQVLKYLLKRSVRILLRCSVEKLSILGSLPLVLAYVLVVGSPVTAVRAGTMFVLFVGALLLDRSPAVWNSLALAGLLILLWDPAALFSVSCLLSFVAVAGLLAAASRWEPLPRWGRATQGQLRDVLWPRARTSAWRLLTASLAATVATAPLAAFFFNRVTPLAVLVNLVAVPVVGWLVIPCGLITAVVALVWAPAAIPFLEMTSAGTRLVVAVAQAFGEIPFANFWVGRPTVLELGAFYLGVFGWLGLKGWPWRRWMVLGCAITICFSVAGSVIRSRSTQDLVITFLSVGQGDSTLVEFPGGRRMLVDGGFARQGYHDAGRRYVLPFLGYRRIGRLDYVVASHGQADHYGGLYSVVKELPPDEFWISPEGGCEPDGYTDLLDLCEEENVPIQRLCGGSEAFWINGVEVEVLNPRCRASGIVERSADCSRRINDRSLVLHMTFGSVSVLLTGDIEAGAERELVRDCTGLRADLLKVPHHGSPRSGTGPFLEAVAPGVAVVSAGYGNRFGFPSEEVVCRYRDRGILLYRTDRDGAVRFRTDGHSLWIETFAGSPTSRVTQTGLCAGEIPNLR